MRISNTTVDFSAFYNNKNINPNDDSFRQAVNAYAEKMLKGLNALDDEEIKKRIAEFTAKHYPENGTYEEKTAFFDKLAEFIRSLHSIVVKQNTESLITTSNDKEAQDEQQTIANMIRNKIQTSNLSL